MPRYVLRLWLPDRPGALGQVASRIGSVHADVVGIEILERGGGRAVDDLVVALPSDDLVDLLVREVTQVEGVDVEWIQAVEGADHDPAARRCSRPQPVWPRSRTRAPASTCWASSCSGCSS